MRSKFIFYSIGEPIRTFGLNYPIFAHANNFAENTYPELELSKEELITASTRLQAKMLEASEGFLDESDITLTIKFKNPIQSAE